MRADRRMLPCFAAVAVFVAASASATAGGDQASAVVKVGVHLQPRLSLQTQPPNVRPGAGERPAGDRKFSTGLEPAGFGKKHPPPGAWNFYSYWWKMKRSGDGRQAFWIDGRKVGDFGGIEWRKTAELTLNAFWLMSYVTDRWTDHKTNRVWFDDVVVATEYIGPIVARSEPAQK